MPVDVLTETIIDRPLEVVAGYASDPSNAPQWYANIASVAWQTPPPLGLGSRLEFVAHFLGRRLAYTYEIVELAPLERLVMRTAQGPFPMETTYTWAAYDEGRTQMTLRNRGEPSGFSAVAAPLMATAMRRANTKDLARLKELLESR